MLTIVIILGTETDLAKDGLEVIGDVWNESSL